MTEYVDYPFDSHFLTLADGLRCHYIDEQPHVAADRPVLLMVHGNPTWSYFWRKLITKFRNQFRSIAVDHIGCGLSDKPNESAYPFTLERRIADLVQLIEHLDLKRITLIAHDWGGAIGMGAAVRMPDQFEQFVLMNTAAFRSIQCPMRIRLCRTPLLGRLAIQGLNLFSLGTLWMASANRKNLTPEVRSALLAPYDSWEHRLAVYRFVQDIPLSQRHPSYETLKKIEESLPLFRERRVCLIWGMLDWCFSPEFLKRFLQFFPESVVHRLEKAHHLLLEDAPEEVAGAIETFLTDVQRAANVKER
jgi:haloalkane dehalogenase